MRKYERDKKKKKKMIIKAFLILSQQTNNQGIIVELLFAFSREQLKKGGSPLSFTHVIGKMHL
jgi:hypothetical protein